MARLKDVQSLLRAGMKPYLVSGDQKEREEAGKLSHQVVILDDIRELEILF